MRNLQFRRVKDQLVEHEQIKVESTRGVFETALPAMLLFDCLKLKKQLLRLERGFQRGNGITKSGCCVCPTGAVR